jgi:hypothetical protein
MTSNNLRSQITQAQAKGKTLWKIHKDSNLSVQFQTFRYFAMGVTKNLNYDDGKKLELYFGSIE